MAGRTQFEDFDKLVDPMAEFNFDMFVAQVPGVSGFNARDFKTKIMSTTIPGRTIEPIQVDLHGATKEFAGRAQYSRSLSFQMLETRDAVSRATLNAWHRYTRNNSSQGTYFSEYSTPVDLLQYDEHNIAITCTRLYGCWLSAFDDISVDGSSSAAVSISGTLTYQYWDLVTPDL